MHDEVFPGTGRGERGGEKLAGGRIDYLDCLGVIQLVRYSDAIAVSLRRYGGQVLDHSISVIRPVKLP